MESAVQPAAKLDIEKLAKFEEFHQKCEKEKLERLARIELRKKQLRDRRLTDIQKSHVGLHNIPTTGNVKQQRRTMETVRPPSAVSSTQAVNGKSHDVQFRPVKSGSTAKRQNVGESLKRATLSSQVLPPTASKGNKENLKPKGILSNSEKEKRWSTLGTSSKASNPVKRRLPMSHSGSVKKPRPEANDNVAKQSQVQKVNALRKPETAKRATARDVLHKEAKPANKISANKVEGSKPEVQVVKKEQEKKLPRERALELWKQKKQQQATEMNARPSSSSSSSAFPRRGVSLPSKPGVKPPKLSSVRSSTTILRTSSVKAPALFLTRVKADAPGARIDKRVVVGSKVEPMAMRAKSCPSSSHQQNQALYNPEQSEKDLTETLPELASECRKPPATLETIFSEPCTPEVKPPRMSTPYSNRCVATPGNALALSSILGSRRKNFTSTFTPKTPKTPYSAMRDKLREWLEAHGKTPSQYRHLACHGVTAQEMATSLVTAKRSNCILNSTFKQDSKDVCSDAEREAANKKAVVEMLSEVLLLAREGFPTEQLTGWIQRVSEKVPFAVSLARYWSLKAYLAALGSGGKTAALQVLEEALTHNATPSEELEKVRALIIQDLFNSPYKRLTNEVQSENVFESSAIKFSLKKVPAPMPIENADTSVPRSLRKSSQLPQNIIITPVRRSTRKSCGHLPVGLRDHDVIIESIDEIPDEDRLVSLFRSNVALDLKWKFAENEAAATE